MDWLVGRRGKGRINWVVVAGGEELRHVASRRSGWEENVGQQKLAVAWMMLSSCASGQGGMSRVFGSRSLSSSRLVEEGPSREWERELCLRGGKWCGQIVRVQVVAGLGQLNRLEEISDGNVGCFVEAVDLFFVPFEAWVGGRMRSGVGVVGGGEGTECKSRRLKVDEQTNFARPGL